MTDSAQSVYCPTCHAPAGCPCRCTFFSAPFAALRSAHDNFGFWIEWERTA